MKNSKERRWPFLDFSPSSRDINVQRNVNGIKNWLNILKIPGETLEKVVEFVTSSCFSVNRQIIKSTITH